MNSFLQRTQFKKTMEQINEDCMIEMLSYLDPLEIILFYESCNLFQKIINELSRHKGFVVKCTKIVADETVLWFQNQHIQIKLLEKCKKNVWGDQKWYLNGKLHRDNDLPAVVRICGDKQWYQNGYLHRDNDLPAEIYATGTQIWYLHGLLHRDNDLPTLIKYNGTQKWYQNGELHRDEDKPAEIYPSGTQIWFRNGKVHRDNNLPAVIFADGHQIWVKEGIMQK